MQYFTNKINEIIKIFYPTSDYKNYIKHNNKLFRNSIKKLDGKNGEILIDLFHHYPFINIWSIITNIIAQKKNYKIKYFYFKFYDGYLNKSKIYSKKLFEIYKSFNVQSSGIDERDVRVKINVKKYNSIISKIKNKSDLVKFKYKNIKIGDLIYSTYLRTKMQATINLDDKYFKDLLKRSIFFFDYTKNYLIKNNVKLVIVSHPYYFQYGILTRIANSLNIPVVMIYSKNRGHNLFRLKIINKKYPIEDFEYYNFKKNFKKLQSKSNKIKIGKKIIEERFSNKFKEQLPYMKKNIYNKKFERRLDDNGLDSVFIFAHDFFDNPHRYRWMIFEDFYEQLKFFEELAKKTPEIKWYLKPHPNALGKNFSVIENFFGNSRTLNLIDKNINNLEILSKKPKFIITNHGTVAHEFAYNNIPVINTGDNPHINYQFCLHAKNKKELKAMILNFEKYKSLIKFDKKDIYEFIYMQYYHTKNEFNEFNLDKLNLWSSENNYDHGLSHYYKMNKKKYLNLYKYIDAFCKKTNLI